jgi:ferrous iron transport protein B
MTLDKLEIGKDAVIQSVGGQGALRQHILDMGLVPGTEVTLIKKAPMGDPIQLRLRGYELTLRLADAAQIEIQNVHDTDTILKKAEKRKDIPHPGMGEMGI